MTAPVAGWGRTNGPKLASASSVSLAVSFFRGGPKASRDGTWPQYPLISFRALNDRTRSTSKNTIKSQFLRSRRRNVDGTS